MLHTVSHSPYQIDMNALVNTIAQDDVLVLLQDGVTAALKDSRWLALLIQRNPINIYVLREDIEARGLLLLIDSHVEIIDYSGLVDLSVDHYPQVNW
ncbi:sulfurtransferase complex subunit TusB [Budviciaceae bacterium CWB-B4]|uniref:Sulfurtransferase complex subunit TusB n=1 Tax=Limnobaculum xujianqingii TaxID=2738837 RepID=A0A9D7AKB7_9GAMM|nr:sulfurtransferase complex subunit TusB [Limnobaculum xujianqingii]MBK5074361.1 sulfurtransferase complex subunit TusB [Limnobaculum xujianqingii]MBK5177670.1 sulfurtransferase complex subunit TusB [Limnobaculum xujianqingii]